MKNRTLGGLLLLSGTTIGAGMLAMPLACANVGFSTTALLLIALWLLTNYSALLLIEAQQYTACGTNLSNLAGCHFGHYGYWITHTTLLLLLYSLTAAYITAGGNQLAVKLTHWFALEITSHQGILLLTSITAMIVCCSTTLVDVSNRLLFGLKIGALIMMLTLMAPQVQQKNLLTLPSNHSAILSAIPVMFTAFGFHGTLPSIVRYLEGNTRQLRRVVIAGSTLPLLVYLSWQWATQGILNQQQFLRILADCPSLQGLIQAINREGVDPWIHWAVDLFANLALATSLLGVSLGLLDYWTTLSGRLKAGAMTFLPPMAFALFYPQGFMMALGYAAIALAVLALLLPAAVVWKIRRQHRSTSSYRVRGGPLTLILITACGLSIVIIQLAINLSWLPAMVS